MNLITPAQAIDLVIASYTKEPDLVGPVENHPIRIHYSITDGVLYVIPEGSKTKEDWIDDARGWADLDIPKISHGQSFIPEGFYASSMSVKDTIGDVISNHEGPVCIVGHSRGGAQAAVLAKLLSDDGMKIEKIYLLEPARAFIFKIPVEFQNPDEPFDAGKIQVWGTWDGNDPVPHVPFGEQFRLDIIGRSRLDPFECHHVTAVAADWFAKGG